MSFFIDTSALFKRYQPEKGTEPVCRIIEDKNQSIFISSISIIEVISNLKRIFEVDKITSKDQFHFQRSFFYQDLKNLNIIILDVAPEDVILADKLITKNI